MRQSLGSTYERLHTLTECCSTGNDQYDRLSVAMRDFHSAGGIVEGVFVVRRGESPSPPIFIPLHYTTLHY